MESPSAAAPSETGRKHNLISRIAKQSLGQLFSGTGASIKRRDLTNETGPRRGHKEKYEEKRNALIGSLATKRLDVLATADAQLQGKRPDNPPYSEDPDLNRLIGSIREKIANPPSQEPHAHAQSIRRDIEQALHIIYENDEGTFEDEQNYLGHLAYALIMCADASEPFGEFGEVLIREYGDAAAKEAPTFSIKQFTETMDEAVLHFSFHNMVHKTGNLFSRVVHTKQSAASFQGQFGRDPVSYNPHEAGNSDAAGGHYIIDGKRIRFQYGPTPTGNMCYKEKLRQLHRAGGLELRHNLQHPEVSGEYERSRELVHLEEENEALRLFATPMDGPVLKMRGECRNGWKTGAELLDRYANFAFTGAFEPPQKPLDAITGSAHRQFPMTRAEGHHDNGFYIGPQVMNDDQFRAAFAAVNNVFGDLDMSGMSEDERVATGQALQVLVQGVISYGALHKLARDAVASGSPLEPNFGQACKQDIDRGVVLNLITRVLFRLRESGGDLSRDEVCEMIGAAVGRAEITDGRMILINNRYQVLSDALLLLADRVPEMQKALATYATTFAPGDDPGYGSVDPLNVLFSIHNPQQLQSAVQAAREAYEDHGDGEPLGEFLTKESSGFQELSEEDKQAFVLACAYREGFTSSPGYQTLFEQRARIPTD